MQGTAYLGFVLCLALLGFLFFFSSPPPQLFQKRWLISLVDKS